MRAFASGQEEGVSSARLLRGGGGGGSDAAATRPHTQGIERVQAQAQAAGAVAHDGALHSGAPAGRGHEHRTAAIAQPQGSPHARHPAAASLRMGRRRRCCSLRGAARTRHW